MRKTHQSFEIVDYHVGFYSLIITKNSTDFSILYYSLVAEAGFERCDFQVMGLVSYRTALLRDCVYIL